MKDFKKTEDIENGFKILGAKVVQIIRNDIFDENGNYKFDSDYNSESSNTTQCCDTFLVF